MPVLNNSAMPTISVAGMRVTALNRSALLSAVQTRLHNHIPTRIVTPYSEFLFRAMHDSAFRDTLNSADFALPDGVGILWASTFLSTPLTARTAFGTWVQAIGQMVWTGATIVLCPSRIAQIIPEVISGSDFVFDLCKLAVQEQAPIFIAGGFGEVPKKTAQILQERFPGLKIAGTSNVFVDTITGPAAQSLVETIRTSQARMLFLALGPYKQELFMMHHWESLQVDLAIGLGGTFDYITGKSRLAPDWLQKLGLEWLFRLIAEPYRAPRIYRATVGLITTLIRYKVQLWTKKSAAGTL